MKVKKIKPKIKGNVKNPKPKSLQQKSLRSMIRNSDTKKKIRQDITELKIKRREIISKIEKHLKKIKSLPVSMSGLEKLSENSIQEIQKNRTNESMNLVKQVGNLTVTSRQLTRLENRYRNEIQKIMKKY